jgi:DNA-binding MarR family transcriptional regulator
MNIEKKILDNHSMRVKVHAMNLNDSHSKTEVSGFQVQQLGELVSKLFQCCQERMQYQSERFGLPDAELRCLMLFERERYLTPKNIAHKLNVVKSRVTSILNKLLDKKYLQKIQDPEDSRVTLVSTTAEGNRKIGEIREFQDFLYDQMLRQMAPEQRKAMMTNLNLLKASMESLKELMG